MKTPVVLIPSSSDEDDDDDGNFEEEDLESEYSSQSQDDINDSESDDQEYNEEEEIGVESDEEEFSDNQGSNDVEEQSLNECKAYLRKHRLRLSGTKEECIQRIQEHKRLKDGDGESLYPRSSFSINCTGDACKGDVVCFRQKVDKKFDKGANGGNMMRKRTIAGRIVKESYGASKQQHTFTVEVLWNKGSKRLPPLSTLLVKGRVLYRYGTYRQAWKSEAERSKVLQEKHNRGEAARNKRKSNKTDFASNNDHRGGRKRTHTRPSRSKQQPTQSTKHNSNTRQGSRAPSNKTSNRNAVHFQKTEMPFRSDPNRPLYPYHHQPPLPFSYDRISPFQNLLPPLYNNIGQPPPPQQPYQYRPPGGHYHYNI